MTWYRGQIKAEGSLVGASQADMVSLQRGDWHFIFVNMMALAWPDSPVGTFTISGCTAGTYDVSRDW